jgi:hypothetical protein
MRITVELPDAAIEMLDAKTNDDSVSRLRLADTMKLYGLGRLACREVPASAGNGRVEFLHRLAKFGGSLLRRTLAPGLAAPRSIPS